MLMNDEKIKRIYQREDQTHQYQLGSIFLNWKVRGNHYRNNQLERMSEQEVESGQHISGGRTQRQGGFGMREEQNGFHGHADRLRQDDQPNNNNPARLRRKRVGTNRARSLIVICKEVLRRNLSEIRGRTQHKRIKKIILKVWLAFRDNTAYNKQIFTVMFNQIIYQELAQYYGLKKVLDDCYEREYREAMEILREFLYDKILDTDYEHMIQQNSRMNDPFRKIMLAQYIDKFVNSELIGNEIKFYRTKKYDKMKQYKFKSQPNRAQPQNWNEWWNIQVGQGDLNGLSP